MKKLKTIFKYIYTFLLVASNPSSYIIGMSIGANDIQDVIGVVITMVFSYIILLFVLDYLFNDQN